MTVPHELLLERYDKNTLWQVEKTYNILRLVQPKRGDRILEVGCSIGTTAVTFGKAGADVVGVDNDAEAIQLAVEWSTSIGDRRCLFLNNKAETAIEFVAPNKVTMIDVVEHIEDDDLRAILRGLHNNPRYDWGLYIYAPNREHWMERMREKNIILKRQKAHIAMRNMDEVVRILRETGYYIHKTYYRPTHLPILYHLEKVLMHLPVVGKLFRRRICIVATNLTGWKDAENR